MATVGLTPIKQRPLTGLMDMRSSPEEMPAAAFRFKANFQVTEATILKRRAGWRKLFSDKFPSDTGDECFCPGNLDLHDQLLPLQTFQDTLADGSCSPTIQTRQNLREHLTMAFEATTPSGNRKLFAGTQSRIYVLNESSGTWKIIADGFGGNVDPGVPARRWEHAQLGNTILFTNDFDKVIFHDIGQPVIGCAQSSVAEVSDLDNISVTNAKVIVEFNGVIMLMNIVEGGARVASRIRWCGLNQPLRWNSPDPETIAGFLDLGFTQQILGALELRGALLVYTDRAIWRIVTTGTSAIFSAVELYAEPENFEGCLAFRHTLISTGDDHYYMGRDGIYRFNNFTTRPIRVEWIHRAAFPIFDHPTLKVDMECCDQVVAGFSPLRKEIWISWPQVNSLCVPSNTLVLNIKYNSADLVDHGFTIFTNYRSDPQMSLTEWLVFYCVCTVPQTLKFYEKEGLPGNLCAIPCTQLFTPQSVYTSEGLISDPSIVNFNKSQADSDSLCALLGDLRVEDFCDTCDSDQIFIGASAVDKSLKEIGENFSRERCINSETGVGEFVAIPGGTGYCSFEGSYIFDGYISILRGTLQLGSDDFEKRIKRFTVAVTSALEPNPPRLKLRIGVSNLALDPNPADPFSINGNVADECEVAWHQQEYRILECPAKKTAAEQIAQKLRNVRETQYPLHRKGRFLHYELSIVDLDDDEVESPAVGGDATLTSLTAWTKLQKV